MKLGKRLLLMTALASVSLAGVYGWLMPTSAQDYASPKCECKYPGPPEEYGIKKRATGPNDENIYTCEVKKCWLPVPGLEGEDGPET
ncbi:MAG TPA: hypothetical protein VFS10_01055 [Pyrinomonadaceae bacterium]|nr:hypothetical protein [Pyrinomonadaceae bacterium]